MTSNLRLFYCLILFASTSSTCLASQQAVIIGGGPTPLESQASIELNTKWIIEIIGKIHPGSISHILYTDGNDSGVDVYATHSPTNNTTTPEPLARVYVTTKHSNYRYYTSRLADSVDSSDKKTVTNTLKNVFSALRKNDELLIIYQGHGGYNKNNTNDNFLRLWGDTKMTATELESLMGNANQDSIIRFIFPQCFSGAFARLIYKDAIYSNGLAKGTRCGFLAQNEYQGAEGCTASVETDTYRDYSSYFFSSITGTTISGLPITNNPDLNLDGKISLREAHLNTLANAHSIDFSLSTSEYYLSEWQPWYLRWLPQTHTTDNAYKKIAWRLAERFYIDIKKQDIISEAAKRLDQLKVEIKTNTKRQTEIKKIIGILQKNIQRELTMIWPQLTHPFTQENLQAINDDFKKIQQTILKQNDYPALVTQQTILEELSLSILESSRTAIQMEKIFHMYRMAQILDQFNRYATDKEKMEYKQLIDCESVTL